ncbi:hypothetical protein JTB14_002061 [Gonioctena quinquepunctata]|nr:hypothetical protein JTB14_002061 [Gonioctena quinquepunctata]
MDSLTLLPEDVPGAVLRCDISIEEHPVSELQRWLECRGYKKTGKKHELILGAGNDSKLLLGRSGKWYDEEIWLSKLVQADVITIWINSLLFHFGKNFPSLVIPKYFNKGHIYTILWIIMLMM